MNKFRKELTLPQLCIHRIEWTRENGNGRDKNDLRFGQRICNEYLKRDESYPEVFYIEEANRAFTMIYDHTIDNS